jgi:glyoxylase-like metal-dependent hydrolase (beta-lactamase superfamily II)
MDVAELEAGLWRWTGWHEEWKQVVGSVYVETEDGVVLVDPLVPHEDRERFLAALDRDVAQAGGEVHVLVTVFWHTRSTAELADRYGARIWAPSRGRAAVARRAGRVTDAFRAGDPLPGGIEAFATARANEVAYRLPAYRTLVPGDVLLGDGEGGIRMCPESWLPDGIGHRELAESLRPLLDVPVTRVLVSHGDPVLRGGQKALAAALAI